MREKHALCLNVQEKLKILELILKLLKIEVENEKF